MNIKRIKMKAEELRVWATTRSFRGGWLSWIPNDSFKLKNICLQELNALHFVTKKKKTKRPQLLLWSSVPRKIDLFLRVRQNAAILIVYTDT